MKDLNKYTVASLKELLATHGLLTMGTKAELVARVQEADPEGTWLIDECTDAGGDIGASYAGDAASTLSAASQQQREIELCRREKQLAEKELAVARLEIDTMRRMLDLEATARRNPQWQATRGSAYHRRTDVRDSVQTTPANNDDDNFSMQRRPPKVNVTTIADLLGEFDGKSGNFETWERQIRLLKTTYQLDDDFARVLMGMRLKGKALEWLHSKPEYITTAFDELLGELRATFHRRQSRLASRRKFEQRIWKRGETFHEYYHEKVILANAIPIHHDEVLEYLIDGIPDETLRNQARIQRLSSTEELLEAFGEVTLRDQRANIPATARRAGRTSAYNREPRPDAENNVEGTMKSVTRCYNCGERYHISANCPTKQRGVKCFDCQERGHVASKCPKKAEMNKPSCSVTEVASEKYIKEIELNGRKIEAVIDSASDISLISASEYIKLGCPLFLFGELSFNGIGSKNNVTLGEFETTIAIDGHSYRIRVHAVPDVMMRHKLLIGANFLKKTEVNMRGKNVTIRPLSTTTAMYKDSDDATAPEVFQIDVSCNTTSVVDVSCITNPEQRAVVSKLANDYKPKKTNKLDMTMKLVLSDDEPVYQSARRLSTHEKDIVDAQIDEWISDGIVQPSTSDYASLIVRLRKAQEEDDSIKKLRHPIHPRLKEYPDVKELLEKEWMMTFQDDRCELRTRASEDIAKIQKENKRTFDKNRRAGRAYREGELVAIKRTQRGPGLKVSHKYFGPYEVIRTLRNQRYQVRKVGTGEGPQETSTAVEYMKLWTDSTDDEFSDEDDEVGDIRGRMSTQDGRL